jgi:hypothetical protein
MAAGCSKPDTKSGKDSIGQSYTITIGELPSKAKLPLTSDMKLAGSDIGAYVQRACIDSWKEHRCDIYVQTDPNGSLLGYLILEEYNGALSFHTDTLMTPVTAGSRACSLGGAIEQTGVDPTKDFKSRSPFETRDGEGMIYIEKVGPNLHVNDERWNYCYSDRHIDDVYVLVGSLVRDLDPKLWPPRP